MLHCKVCGRETVGYGLLTFPVLMATWVCKRCYFFRYILQFHISSKYWNKEWE